MLLACGQVVKRICAVAEDHRSLCWRATTDASKISQAELNMIANLSDMCFVSEIAIYEHAKVFKVWDDLWSLPRYNYIWLSTTTFSFTKKNKTNIHTVFRTFRWRQFCFTHSVMCCIEFVSWSATWAALLPCTVQRLRCPLHTEPERMLTDNAHPQPVHLDAVMQKIQKYPLPYRLPEQLCSPQTVRLWIHPSHSTLNSFCNMITFYCDYLFIIILYFCM